VIRLEHGKPVTFGANDQWCVVHPPGGFGLEVRSTGEVAPEEVVVHDKTVAEPAYAFALSRLANLNLQYTPIGVFRQVDRPSYDALVRAQVDKEMATRTGTPTEELAALLNSGDTWTSR
jgi:2-oxoglutarate ferredoxin oxidoreductase subunit beta